MPLASHFFPPLCQALDLEELSTDPRFADAAARLANREELLDKLAGRFVERTSAEWMEALQRQGIPASPVHTVAEALSMEQTQARDMVVEPTHPQYGTYRADGSPLKISDSGAMPLAGAPTLGEHTFEVLTKLAGLTDHDVEVLRREGAASCTKPASAVPCEQS